MLQLKKALSENTNLAQLGRTQEARIDKLDNEVGRLKYDQQQCHTLIAELRNHFNKLSKEVYTLSLVHKVIPWKRPFAAKGLFMFIAKQAYFFNLW